MFCCGKPDKLSSFSAPMECNCSDPFSLSCPVHKPEFSDSALRAEHGQLQQHEVLDTPNHQPTQQDVLIFNDWTYIFKE